MLRLLKDIGKFIAEYIDAMMRSLLQWYFKSQLGMETGHVYYINFVRSMGGGEKPKPCEFVFDNPRDAELHHRKVDECGTWEFISTVKIISPIELDVTDYRSMLEDDPEYDWLLKEMVNYPTTE